MLPIFPNFKSIAKEDREAILAYTENFSPFSDFNFNSLFSWDTTGETQISDLNGNLVVQMPDYLTSNNVLSFVGNTKPLETIETLLEYAKKNSISDHLTFVPEEAISGLEATEIKLTEEEDNFDYIFSTEKLSELAGRPFKAKRHLASRFIKDCPEAVFATTPLSDSSVHDQILIVLDDWIKKQEDINDAEQENKAIRRLLTLHSDENESLVVSGVYIDGLLVAFSIDEILDDKQALSHFYKVKSGFSGASEYLNMKTATFLKKSGIDLWNWEQDLGIEGLRKSKSSYRPVKFLKKYAVHKPEL